MTTRRKTSKAGCAPPAEVPPEALDRICGGSPAEFGEQVAAFIMKHMFI